MTSCQNTDVPMSGIEQMLRRLALKAKGLSGADIEFLVRQARQRARRQQRQVTYADFEALLASKSPPRSLDLRFRLAVHEAAHAVVRIHLGAGTISSITINDATGSAYVTGAMPISGEVGEVQLMSMLVSILAGRAAEEEFCEWASVGAGGAKQSDLAAATRFAFDIETRFGFGSEWPLLYREAEDCFSILVHNRPLAENVHRRLQVAYATAQKIVAHHAAAIEVVGKKLLRHDTLEGPQLDEVLARIQEMVLKKPYPTYEPMQ